MLSIRCFICLIAISILPGCDGSRSHQVGPDITFYPPNPPSEKTIILPPPTIEQQVQQPQSPTCAPSVGLTLYRMVTGKDSSFDQVVAEMQTNANGTQISDFMFWLNNHEMVARSIALPSTWAVDMIKEQLKAGYYVIPLVNEDAVAGMPHVFIVYGVDGDRILISDSNRHFGVNRFAVDAHIFQSEWLVNVGTKESPAGFLIFVSKEPRQKTAYLTRGVLDGISKMPHGNLLVKTSKK